MRWGLGREAVFRLCWRNNSKPRGQPRMPQHAVPLFLEGTLPWLSSLPVLSLAEEKSRLRSGCNKKMCVIPWQFPLPTKCFVCRREGDTPPYKPPCTYPINVWFGLDFYILLAFLRTCVLCIRTKQFKKMTSKLHQCLAELLTCESGKPLSKCCLSREVTW